MGDRRVGGWRFDVGALVGAWAFFFLLHPPPGLLWFDHSWIAYNLLPVPLTPAGMSEAISWQATVHSSGLVRPARAVQWWLAGKALGCGPLGYYVINVLTLGVAVWAVTRVASQLTTSRTRGLLVGACLAVSYATVYSILYFGFALAAACAFGGLAAYFGSEEREGPWRRRLQAGAVSLLLLAGLSHETFLAFALVPVAHAAIVRRERPAMLRALLFLVIFPVYQSWSWILALVYGGAPSILSGMISAVRESPGVLLENPARVLFAVLTGGLPLDPLRALPYFPEFSRIRELTVSLPGLATLAAVVAWPIALAGLALARSSGDAATQRRIAFCLVWLVLSSVPLMLPVGTPEAFHLTGALPALFLIWTEALSSQSGRVRLSAVVLCLLVWAGVHVAARWVLFQRDIPMMARSVKALHQVLARAQLDGHEASVVFFPAQVGGHYGMMPTVPPLYSGGANGGCRWGERINGCLLEPSWVWSTLRSLPRMPGACRAQHGILVGPLDARAEHVLKGSRRMLAHPAVSFMERRNPRLLAACRISSVRPANVAGAAYWLYEVDVSQRVRWYRFSLEAGPALVPIPDCPEAIQERDEQEDPSEAFMPEKGEPGTR